MTLQVAAALAILALIPALIATAKGRNFIVWWLFGLVLLPIAFFASLLVSRSSRVECPVCREQIDRRASVCPHCRSDLRAVAAG